MTRTLKTVVVFILFLKFNLSIAQDPFIDINYGENNGYTLYNDENITRNQAFTDMVEYNEDVYVSSIDVNGNFHILKYDSQGILDTTFGENGSVNIMDRSFYSITAHNLGFLTTTLDQKLLFVNTSGTPYGENNNVLVTKINLDGTLDESYGTNGQYLTTNLPSGVTLLDVKKTAIDEVIITGYNTSLSAPEYFQNITISKLNAQGNLDNSFGDEGVITLAYDNETYIPSYAFYKDQSAYILFNNTFGDAYITKYETNTMNYDTDFGINGQLEINNFEQNETATTFMVDENNSIYVSGSRPTGNGLHYELFLYKYTNSSLDLDFGEQGIVNFEIAETASSPKSFTIKEHDDKILITGSIYIWDTDNYQHTLFTQYNMDGSLDDNFGDNGIIINTIFNDTDYTNDYLNYEDSIIACGLCTSENESHPCLVKYLKKDASLSSNDVENEIIGVFPNPVDDVLYLKTNYNINDIAIYDITGRLVLKSSKSIQNKINISSLKSGSYFVKTNSSNETFNFRILKN